MKNIRTNTESGFTIVEVVVAITVGALFIASILILSSVVLNISTQNDQWVRADQLAYNNMRNYANGENPWWADCAAIQAASNDTRVITVTGDTNGVRGTVEQRVEISAPYGCSGASTLMPIRVVSKVTYGPASNRQEVVHATYAGE